MSRLQSGIDSAVERAADADVGAGGVDPFQIKFSRDSALASTNGIKALSHQEIDKAFRCLHSNGPVNDRSWKNTLKYRLFFRMICFGIDRITNPLQTYQITGIRALYQVLLTIEHLKRIAGLKSQNPRRSLYFQRGRHRPTIAMISGMSSGLARMVKSELKRGEKWMMVLAIV